MADDPVERAARIRKSLANTVKEVRGGNPAPAAGEAGEAAKPGKAKKDGGKTEDADSPERTAHDRDVNALLDHTRAVIDHTRKVIEQTRANLQRLTRKDSGDAGKE
ncbi:MAG TPA: hypothetical protein VF092_12520 [Longimicrobium sp.]